MTYGFRPANWPAFQAELRRRGIATEDIEKVDMRPEPSPATGTIRVTVTLRSGEVHAWSHDERVPA
jgi:hypothetical protein